MKTTGELLLDKTTIIFQKFLKSLKEWSKGASSAIHR